MVNDHNGRSPKPGFSVLKDLAQVKAIADPIRMRLLEVFCCQPMTTKQAARVLKKPPTQLYHHVDALARAGVIKLVRTQKKRGTVEKYYQAVADRFVIKRELLNLQRSSGPAGPDQILAVVSAMLDETAAEINAGVARGVIRKGDKRYPMVLARSRLSGDAEQITRTIAQIQGLLKDCGGRDKKPDDIEYAFMMAFYPVKKRGR